MTRRTIFLRGGRLFSHMCAALLILFAQAAAGCEGQEQPDGAGIPLSPAPRDYAAEGRVWKEAVLAAAQRNKALNDYRFEYELDAQDESYRWSGTAVSNPLRVQGEIQLGKQDEVFSVPVYVTEDHLYLSIPTVNLPGEYIAASLADAAAPASFGADDWAVKTLEKIDPQWIRAADGRAPEEGALRSVEIVVAATSDNMAHLSEAIRSGLQEWKRSSPEWFAWLVLYGLPERFQPDEGSFLSFTIDADGLLVFRRMELTNGIGKEGGKRYSFSFRLLDSDAGASVSGIPERVLPLEHLLAFLRAGD